MSTDASLDALRAMRGNTTTKDDAQLASALQTAGEHVRSRVMSSSWNSSEVQTAVLLLANRLMSRSRSPEGTAGFGGEGVVIRILSNDPDINRLLEHHIDCSNVGIA